MRHLCVRYASRIVYNVEYINSCDLQHCRIQSLSAKMPPKKRAKPATAKPIDVPFIANAVKNECLAKMRNAFSKTDPPVLHIDDAEPDVKKEHSSDRTNCVRKGLRRQAANNENNAEDMKIVIKKEIKVEHEPQFEEENKTPIQLEVDPVVIKKEIDYEDEDFVDTKPKSKWQPKNWEIFLENLRLMRLHEKAPVDDMGCDKCMDETAPPEIKRYQALIALMLSSQTKDQVTFAAMQRLIEHGLTVDNILATSDDVLEKLIYPVGFYKSKAKFIKKTTKILKDEYNSDIPDTVKKLCTLNGVGPKMAHICMKVAWNKVSGIGVDTHVHRISNRIGWVKKPTQMPESTREALESWLPLEHWSEVNHLLVGFGQTVCKPTNPQCSSCLNNLICPYGMKEMKTKTALKVPKVEK